jgi:hypothetical protein
MSDTPMELTVGDDCAAAVPVTLSLCPALSRLVPRAATPRRGSRLECLDPMCATSLGSGPPQHTRTSTHAHADHGS